MAVDGHRRVAVLTQWTKHWTQQEYRPSKEYDTVLAMK